MYVAEYDSDTHHQVTWFGYFSFLLLPNKIIILHVQLLWDHIHVSLCTLCDGYLPEPSDTAAPHFSTSSYLLLNWVPYIYLLTCVMHWANKYDFRSGHVRLWLAKWHRDEFSPITCFPCQFLLHLSTFINHPIVSTLTSSLNIEWEEKMHQSQIPSLSSSKIKFYINGSANGTVLM